MLIAMITAPRQITPRQSALEFDTRRATWVHAYRTAIQSAECWAQGKRGIHHSIETQERVFRMAEQLQRHGVTRAEVFLHLQEADRAVAAWRHPESAVRAGYRAIGALFQLNKESIIIMNADGEQPDWRQFGFQPIAFDGRDPAAYAWIIYELTLRARDRVIRKAEGCRCHPESVPTDIGFARI
jgi:hypothetical protein